MWTCAWESGSGSAGCGKRKTKKHIPVNAASVLTSALARDKRRDHARGRRLDGSSRALARWTVAARLCHRRGRRRRAVASARGRATPSAPAMRVAPPTTRGAGRRSSRRRETHLCVARQAQPRGVRAAEHQRFRRRAVVAGPAHVGVRPSRARALGGVRVLHGIRGKCAFCFFAGAERVRGKSSRARFSEKQSEPKKTNRLSGRAFGFATETVEP